MGPLDFIKKTFTSKQRDVGQVWSKDYIQMGYVRFSDSSYGLPVKWIERNYERLEELALDVIEVIDNFTAPVQRIATNAVLRVTNPLKAVALNLNTLSLEYKIAFGTIVLVTIVLVYQYFLKGYSNSYQT
jgi:hypothetical protein